MNEEEGVSVHREGEIRFSVIVPVYNVQRYLPLCVKSVAEQPGPPDWECILVDDGSTDACGALCDAFAAEIPGVVALHQKNQGLAAARNTGIAAAKGEWLLFLDSDDEWAPDMLAHLRRTLEEHPGYDWYVARYLSLDEADGVLREPAAVRLVPGGFESGDYAARVARLYDSAHWSVWKFCLRRQFLAESGVTFWPGVVWAEDYPFDLLLLRHCHRLYFADFVMTHYRENRAGSLMNANLPKHFTGILAALRGFAQLFAEGGCLPAERTEILRRTANAFWPEARAAACRDKSVRHACAPLIDQCKPLYDYGDQCRGRADWALFRWLLKLFGARFALWAAGLLKR